MAALTWLDRDRLQKKLFSEVDQFADDEHSLTDIQRQERLDEIEPDALAIEREEEALVCLAEEQGLSNISRRPNADPVAVLGLVVNQGAEGTLSPPQ